MGDAGQPNRQPRVVGQGSSGADDDRPAPSPAELHLVAGLFPGDPLAGSVGGSAASVEARGVLPAHPGASVDLAEGPIGVEGCGFLGKNPGDHLDAVGTQPLFSPGATGLGSDWAMTTRAIPASTRAWLHGPVRPV